MRLPRKIKQGEIIEIRVKIRYPSTTGLKLKDEEKNIFARDKPAVFLQKMEVIYDNNVITEYNMTSATSPDPLIRFKMRADKEGPIKVMFTTNAGVESETTENIKFSN